MTEQKYPLFPPGFTYRPPVESVCDCCGAKHMDGGYQCSPCRDALQREAQRSF